MPDRQLELGDERDVALIDLLDRALAAGVVLTGDITLSLADVDLVQLNLRLLLASVDTVLGAGPEHVLGAGDAER